MNPGPPTTMEMGSPVLISTIPENSGSLHWLLSCTTGH